MLNAFDGFKDILEKKVFCQGKQEVEGVCLDEPSEYQEQFIPGKGLPYAMALAWFQIDYVSFWCKLG